MRLHHCKCEAFRFLQLKTLRLLKFTFTLDFSFKDVPGTWNITVEYSAPTKASKGSITVLHSKVEQAKQEGAFTFTWQLLAQFDDQMQELQLAQLRIPMITIVSGGPVPWKNSSLSSLWQTIKKLQNALSALERGCTSIFN